MKSITGILMVLAVFTTACTGASEPSPTPVGSAPALTQTPQASLIPALEYPAEGTLMDNGRGDGKDTMAWYFDWSAVPGATQYELLVIHLGASVPAINKEVVETSYYDDAFAVRTAALTDWTWKVRAKVGGQWRAWSETRTFNVEELGIDPPSLCNDPVCSRARLPISTSTPTARLPVVLPEGLTMAEFPISRFDCDRFEPIGVSMDEVLSLHRAERKKRVRYDRVWDEPAGTDPEKAGHYSLTLDGVELTAQEMNGSTETGQKSWGQVLRAGQLVYQTPQEPVFADQFLRGFWAYQADWFLEIAHAVAVKPEVCLLGDIVQGGVSLSERYGYNQAFDFQLMNGKPFYFFERNGNIGISYAGQIAWLGYDEVPHFSEIYGCAGSASLELYGWGGITPLHSENMVAFYAHSGDRWYYVEIGVFP
jgi:hypothetical protein